MDEHRNNLEEVTIVPSSGGVFEISLNDNLLFSKKKEERFPEENEAENIIRDNIK